MDFFSKSAHPLLVVNCSIVRQETARYLVFNFELQLSKKTISEAPLNIAAEFKNIADLKLKIYEGRLSQEIEGVNLEIFSLPEEPAPLVCIRKAVLSKLRVYRDKKLNIEDQVSLAFQCGCEFDPQLWKWAADYITCMCFVRFEMAQTSFEEFKDGVKRAAGDEGVKRAMQNLQTLAEKDNTTLSVKFPDGEEVVLAKPKSKKSSGKHSGANA
jgi:hypothetical protein